MNHKHEALWLLKRCTLYILCTLILSNYLHLTIVSSLTLIQNELWVPKCCHAHSKVLFFMFRVSKKCHQDFSLLHTYYTCYTSLAWVNSGEKWLTCSVFSPISWMKPSTYHVFQMVVNRCHYSLYHLLTMGKKYLYAKKIRWKIQQKFAFRV
jgi:hypothetical protein